MSVRTLHGLTRWVKPGMKVGSIIAPTLVASQSHAAGQHGTRSHSPLGWDPPNLFQPYQFWGRFDAYDATFRYADAGKAHERVFKP